MAGVTDRVGEGDVDFADIQVNETDFKRITHKDALAALRASDKVKGRRKGQNSKISFPAFPVEAKKHIL